MLRFLRRLGAFAVFLACAGCGNEPSAPADSSPVGASGSGSLGTATGGFAGAGLGGGMGGRGGAGGGSYGAGAGAGGGSAGALSNSGRPSVGACPVFPDDDPWNRDVSLAPVDPAWTDRVRALVGSANIHPDYGVSGATLYGIPVNVVPPTQPLVPVAFDWYEDESDPGPYPFPAPEDIAIEGASPSACDGDCHVLVVQQGACMLYEGYACEHRSDGWHCGNGARWDLSRTSYGQRPAGHTSADAAGLPILPGLVRYDEVRRGEVRHAIRFTLPCTRASYVAPATHYAVPGGCDENDPNAPPMGIRMRLRPDFDDSSFPSGARAVSTAMKRYGLILADNGSSFYFQGESNPGWTRDDIEPLKTIPASAFEAVDVPPLEP